MGLNANGRDWGSVVNWDDLGKAYASMIIVWTAVLAVGMLWLILNRRLAFIRMRNLPLMVTSTCFLHVYLVKIFLAYTTNGHFTCSAEFWIMSIYLPFGIALFQANVMQLRSISEQQNRILQSQLSSVPLRQWHENPSLQARWKRLTEAQKGYIAIALGMLVQLVVTTVLYTTSPVLQGDWSSFGSLPFNKGQALCRRSYEWIPSAFWQLFWSWTYGPYILFHIRHVRDTHHWRFQTFVTVIAGLPGAPLWLAAVFGPTTFFKPVNKYFVPPMWLAPGIIVMQAAAIFLPIYECFEARKAIKQLSGSLKSDLDGKRPESASTDLSSHEDDHDAATRKLFEDLAASGCPESRSMYRLSALERALVINHKPLLHFAATRDFSAENIVFLVNVHQWKSNWQKAPRGRDDKITLPAKVELLQAAVEIYVESICQRTAEFPINIEDSVDRPLREILEPYQGQLSSARLLGSTGGDPVLVKGTGITVEWTSPESPTKADFDVENLADSRRNPWAIKYPGVQVVNFNKEDKSQSPPRPRGPVIDRARAVEGWKANMTEDGMPKDFNEQLFDAAESSITILVLTNTWRKFVREQQKSTLGY